MRSFLFDMPVLPPMKRRTRDDETISNCTITLYSGRSCLQGTEIRHYHDSDAYKCLLGSHPDDTDIVAHSLKVDCRGKTGKDFAIVKPYCEDPRKNADGHKGIRGDFNLFEPIYGDQKLNLHWTYWLDLDIECKVEPFLNLEPWSELYNQTLEYETTHPGEFFPFPIPFQIFPLSISTSLTWKETDWWTTRHIWNDSPLLDPNASPSNAAPFASGIWWLLNTGSDADCDGLDDNIADAAVQPAASSNATSKIMCKDWYGKGEHSHGLQDEILYGVRTDLRDGPFWNPRLPQGIPEFGCQGVLGCFRKRDLFFSVTRLFKRGAGKKKEEEEKLTEVVGGIEYFKPFRKVDMSRGTEKGWKLREEEKKVLREKGLRFDKKERKRLKKMGFGNLP